MTTNMTKIIDKYFREAIVEGAFPAAEILVAKGGDVVFESHYGDARRETCFDIASLTKPISSVTLTMMLLADGLLTADDTVYQWLAGARKPYHRQMTIAHLVNHVSGLPAWQPYFRELPESLIGTDAGKTFILDACFNEPLISKPGEKTIYSDLGYIILGEILEQAGNAPLDVLFKQRIAKPLGLADTFFVRAAGKHRRFAPTEDCPWRERVIHGEVHDQNAYALGGVAGHAGLFSTARDIHKFTTAFVRSYHGKSDFISPALVQKLIGSEREKPTGDEFVFGWNRPSKKNSASGRHFSQNSIGHLGYTGCSIWIDLEKDFWIILLTNRIHPSTTNQKIKTFRPKMHDLIYDEFIA